MYNVLLVEDDIQIREVIGDFFARRDKISLDLAADGEIGLSKILNGQYDLIVLDIMMPGIDGFELCRIIRGKCRFIQLSSILIIQRNISI